MKTDKNAKWPFDDPRGTPAVTTLHVTSSEMPIVYASRESDEDGEITWHFYCAFPFEMKDAQLVRLDTIINVDRSVLELADLPLGHAAKRRSPQDPWILFQEENVE